MTQDGRTSEGPDADACADWRLLIQADLDGELTPAEAARIPAHLANCPGCGAMQAAFLALSERLRRDVPYHPAPDPLRAVVRARLRAAAEPDEAPAAGQATAAPWWRRLPAWGFGPLTSAGLGFAAAAALALVVFPPHAGDLPALVVADHIRALQPGHLIDVASTDQHTVKPWFDGRLDFAPPVKDFRSEGFSLIGGRLDYIADRPVAALVYKHRDHIIDLFVAPGPGRLDVGSATGNRGGYNYLSWRSGGMAFWAVSDLNARELADFVRLWQAP